MVTVLAAGALLAGDARGAEPPRVAHFTAGEFKEEYIGGRDPSTVQPRTAEAIFRELGRQIVMLVAREEFGLATRDDALLEPIDRDAPETFQIEVEARRRKSVVIRIRRGGRQVFTQETPCQVLSFWPFNYAYDVERDCAGLEQMFEEAGYQRRPSRWLGADQPTPLPERVARDLLAMNHIAQYRAVRELHRLMREEGESFERLAGLARGYANLSQLTLSTPDTRTQAFAARAMLYSMRLRTQGGATAPIRWNEAYVATLLGYPRHALACLQDAEKYAAAAEAEAAEGEAPDGPGGPPTPPDWATLIEDYCHYRTAGIVPEALDRESPLCPLASVLWLRITLHNFSPMMLTRTGGEVMQNIPTCLWVVDTLTAQAGVGFGHFITRHAMRAHALQLATELPATAGVPEAVLNAVEDGPDGISIEGRAGIANALVEAGGADRLEPSLAVLGKNIEAFSVLHAIRRARFIKQSLGASAADEVEEFEPVFANHPDAALVRTLAVRPGAGASAYKEALGGYRFKEANYFSTYSLMRSLPAGCELADGRTIGDVWFHAYSGCTPFELVNIFMVHNSKPGLAVQYADDMQDCSFHAPVRYAILLRHDWQAQRENVDAWLADYGEHPIVMHAAADGLAGDGQDARAIDLYEDYLEQSPDYKVFMKLAALYYTQQPPGPWQETAARVLDHPDPGLNHSNASAVIAATLMHEGDFEAALPHARRAAQSGSGQGYRVLRDCLTGVGDMAGAERVAAVNTRRYGMNFGYDDWYNWCAETGQGELEQAWRLKQTRLQNAAPPGHRDIAFAESLHLLVTGDNAGCRAMLEERLKQKFSPWDTMMLVNLYDEAGRVDDRDRMLQSLIDHDPGDGPRPLYCLASPVFVGFFKTGSVDDDALTAACKRYADGDGYSDAYEHTVNYYLGAMCLRRGKTDEAVERWTGAARFSAPGWERILAWRGLREAGVDPVYVDGRYFGMQLHK
ncbi:MAG: hypothetical protein AAF790_01970 [Planctomycetota bacterium]